MPTYDVTAPNGKQFTIDGDHVPNESELNDIFAKISPPEAEQIRIAIRVRVSVHG